MTWQRIGLALVLLCPLSLVLAAIMTVLLVSAGILGWLP